MLCTVCGTGLLPGKQFCHNCGATAEPGCVKCGAPLQLGFRFCPDCGTPVPGPATLDPPPPSPRPATPTGWVPTFAVASPPSPEERPVGETSAQRIQAQRSSIEGERKLVTVLFCDLAGSTALAERLDPEEYRELLDEYVALCFREIYRFEGIVNQLAGDGVMALFGAPIAHEEAPQRAVWAGLGILVALGELNERLLRQRGIELQARIGIHTGPVVVGNVGNDLKMDYTAIGDTTNLASRLESLAIPGTMLVSEDTYALVRGFFDMKPVGPFNVKGKASRVVAYEVQRGRAVAHKFAIAAERGLTPLVGRDQELAQLEGCYERVKGHLPQVVQVIGETGAGRSRLVHELKERLAPEPTIFEARCAALNQRVPYFPWATMLHQYFGLGDDDTIERAREKIEQQLARIDLNDGRNADFLMRLLSLSEGSDDLPVDDVKRATFEAIGNILYEESQRAPVIVIIEDLHWMDDASREMLERAVGELCRTRVMVIVTHRPELRPLYQTQAALTVINLRRLTDDAAAKIISAIASGPVPPELERLILSKSEGSPFFTEEITRSLLEGGAIEKDSGAYRLTRSVDEISIPSTVQEVIAARLDRLALDSKRVLQVAAVMGRQFSREQLKRILEGDGIDVDRALDDLEARGIIHCKNLFTNDLYRFGESLTQEVAYEGLLLRQRRQLHERIGFLLEATPCERSAERSALLAHHFANSDNIERAAEALLQAAHDAEKVPSFRSAARFYRDAWEILRRDERATSGPLGERAVDSALGLVRMAVFYNAASPSETEPISEVAERIAQAIGEKEKELSLRAYRGMLMISGGRGRFDDGLKLIEQTLATASLSGSLLPGMSRGAAWAYMIDGRFELARRTIEGAIREMEVLPKYHGSDIYVGGHYLRDRILFFSDDYEAARRAALATHEMAIQAANRTVQGGSAATLAMVHLARGEYTEARRWADRSIELSRVTGNTLVRIVESAIVVLCKVAAGEMKATSKLADAIDGMLIEGELLLAPQTMVAALVATGEVDAALGFAQRAYDRASGRLRQTFAAVALAEAIRFHDGTASARALLHYQEATDLAHQIGARSSLAIAQLGIAEILVARGEIERARPHLAEVFEICTTIGMTRFLPRTRDLLSGAEGAQQSA